MVRQSFRPANPAYGLAACLAVRPHLDADASRPDHAEVVARHENLRFAFPSDGVGPVPTLLPAELREAARCGRGDGPSSARAARREANKPFDVEEGPLSRLHLFRRSDHDIVLLQFHHIVADAASIAILLDEVIEAYYALQAGAHVRWAAPAPFRAIRRPAESAGPARRARSTGGIGGTTRRGAVIGARCRPTTRDLSSPLGPGAARNFSSRRARSSRSSRGWRGRRERRCSRCCWRHSTCCCIATAVRPISSSARRRAGARGRNSSAWSATS